MPVAAGTSRFYENFKMAIDTLRGNKLRSALTIVGVIIGVVVVMIISSFISGINVAVEKQIESFGTNSLFLYKYNLGVSTGRRSQEERMRKPLVLDDVTAIKKLGSIATAVPFLDVSNNPFGAKLLIKGSNGKTSTSVQLQGTEPDIEKTSSETLLTGRWFTQFESDSRTNVCIIGQTVVDTYFPNGSPLGEELTIGGVPFKIIGTLEKKDQLFGGGGGNNDQSNIIYMPIGSAMMLKPNSED
ncbi:MAG: ABC transporter permease, partial [Pyrinomonadaceae bacterium]|nr:ABC transporter permease [Pyrinomonadaceae bacterium]